MGSVETQSGVNGWELQRGVLYVGVGKKSRRKAEGNGPHPINRFFYCHSIEDLVVQNMYADTFGPLLKYRIKQESCYFCKERVRVKGFVLESY